MQLSNELKDNLNPINPDFSDRCNDSIMMMMNNYFKISITLGAVFVSLISGTVGRAYAQDATVSSIRTIDWRSSIRSFDLDKPAHIGREFTFNCNAAPIDFTPNQFNAYGTDNYKVNSSICKSALNAGVITIQGGTVTLRLDNGQPFYAGSERNGSRTYDSGAANIGYSFVGNSVAVQTDLPQQDSSVATVKDIDWRSSIRSFDLDKPAYIGREFSFKCSAAPIDFTPNQFNAYGTDNYKVSSSICKSALNAGVITIQGGTVTLRLDNGQPFYAGSERNGSRTYDSGAANIGYYFVGNPVANNDYETTTNTNSNPTQDTPAPNRRRNPVGEGVRKGVERGVEDGVRDVLRDIF